MERYFVDERGGCIAVRDREKTNPDYPGLHEDTTGVVKYWNGTPVSKTCPTCKHTRSNGWEIPQAIKDEAQELCDSLNSPSNSTTDGD